MPEYYSDSKSRQDSDLLFNIYVEKNAFFTYLMLCFLAPCKPQNLSAVVDCGSDSISLTWEASLGSVFYMATAVDRFGTAYTCSSMDVRCQITGLSCESNYTASVMASDIRCNSSLSDNITVETGAIDMQIYHSAITLTSDTS